MPPCKKISSAYKSIFIDSHCLRYYALFLLFFTVIFPSLASADIQPRTFHNASEIYTVTNADPAIQVYEVFDISGTNVLELSNIDSGSNFGGTNGINSGNGAWPFSLGASHTYRILLLNADYSCIQGLPPPVDEYDVCLASTDYAGENFTIAYDRESSGGGEVIPEEELPNVSSGGVAQYGPEIEILFPKLGDILSRLGTISYRAADRNDQGTENEIERYGLAKDPVSLYYSDKVAEWDGSSSVAPADKTLIAAGQPAEASYAWSIADLVPGIFYRIVADVVDATGAFAEAVSDFFTVDFSAPTFIVKADPPATQGRDVAVSIDASESLKEPPTVAVTQTGGATTTLAMAGEGSHYEGTYAVAKGYDGVAMITVSGRDDAGNVGTTIMSGGTFAVGVNPPPTPRVSYPQDNIVVAVGTIDVLGTLRGDTTAMVIVNGADTYTASSSSDGAFAISGIRLSKDLNRGINILSVAARDQAGLASEAVPLRVKYNIAPTVAVSSPAEKASIGATTALAARAADENGDPLAFTYQIIPAQDFDAAQSATSSKNAWDTIGDAVPTASFSWDSTEVEDGQYFLRVIADDGLEKAYSAAVAFSVRNTLPFFRFEDGRRTLTNQQSVAVVGRALAPSALSPRPTITKVEYSVDNGKRWKPVPLTSGGGTSEARFSAPFTGLAEGTRGILWRVKDSRNFYGRASHPVIVDLTAPKTPLVNRPANNAFVTNAGDEDASRSGLQISVAGVAEPQSAVKLQIASTTMTAKAMPDGRFAFRSVDIPRRGANRLEVTSADGAGNVSTAAVVSVVYDNPPAVVILSPKPFRGLAGKAAVSWSASDADGDPIRNIILEYRRGERAFAPLLIDRSKHSFTFDVSALPEAADYQLRLSASDGMATGTDLVRFSVDNTPPLLSSFILDTLALGKGGVLRAHGDARDALSGVEYVEYAVAEGTEEPESFSTALLTGGFLQERATFAVKHPAPLADATYNVYARAVDAAGNASPVLPRAFAVDTSPPRIGSFDVLAQGVRIAPDARGAISLYAGMKALFEVSLEGDTDTASLLVGSTSIPLARDISSGLWQAPIDTGAMGTTTLAVSAVDKAHNAFTGRPIGALIVAERPAAAPAQPSTGIVRGVWEFLRNIINHILSL